MIHKSDGASGAYKMSVSLLDVLELVSLAQSCERGARGRRRHEIGGKAIIQIVAISRDSP